MELLSRWLDNDDYAAAYIIITRSQKRQTEMLGLMPGGGLEAIEQALAQSPQFTLAYANDDAKIFVLSKRAGGQSP